MCVITEFFPVFSRIQSEYGGVSAIAGKSQYSFQMREKTGQKTDYLEI